MQILKADTSVKIVVGPVVAVGDGYTPVTTLSLSTADEAEIMKHDASAVTDISSNTFAAITSMDGYYNLTLTAAQLDTEGMLVIGINDDSLCLPVRHEYMVVNANVYDSLYAAAATDYLQVDTIQVSGTSQTANDNGADINTLLTRIVGTLAAGTHNAQSGDVYAQLPTNFADLAIAVTTGLVSVGTNNDKTGYSLTATTGLGNQTANITGNLSGSVGSVTGAVGSVTGAVGSVTGNVGGNVTGSVGSLGTTAKSDVNAEVVDVIATDTYAEPGQGAPAATTSLAAKINYLFKAWRNKSTQTATTYSLYDDAGTTVDQKATVSDDGTTATKGEVETGP